MHTAKHASEPVDWNCWINTDVCRSRTGWRLCVVCARSSGSWSELATGNTHRPNNSKPNYIEASIIHEHRSGHPSPRARMERLRKTNVELNTHDHHSSECGKSLGSQSLCITMSVEPWIAAHSDTIRGAQCSWLFCVVSESIGEFCDVFRSMRVCFACTRTEL